MEEGLVRYIARNLVDHPDDVNVTRRDTRRTTILELNVNPDDMGRVIGKNGRVANAIRDLLRAVPDTDPNKRIILEIE